MTASRAKTLKSPTQARAEFEWLREAAQVLPATMGAALAREFNHDPFILLIACLLSLRARDRQVHPVVHKLFTCVHSAHDLAACDLHELQAILRPIGFYKAKAATIQNIARIIDERYGGVVPRNLQELEQLPGVGPKTVAFMAVYAFGESAICVDTHVHRLANAFRWVRTTAPEQTQRALMDIFPVSTWDQINEVLVKWGQHVCGSRGIVKSNKLLHEQRCLCR